MASITFTFVDGAQTLPVQYDLAQADFDRIVKWMRASYLNEDGTQPSRAQAAKRASRATVQGWIDGSLRDEKIAAAEEAAGNVPDIPVTEPPV